MCIYVCARSCAFVCQTQIALHSADIRTRTLLQSSLFCVDNDCAVYCSLFKGIHVNVSTLSGISPGAMTTGAPFCSSRKGEVSEPDASGEQCMTRERRGGTAGKE
jgi:hypothetical protein